MSEKFMKYEYYSSCPLCKDYYEVSSSLHEAKEKLEQHETEKHKGKQIGTFGWKKVLTSD